MYRSSRTGVPRRNEADFHDHRYTQYRGTMADVARNPFRSPTHSFEEHLPGNRAGYHQVPNVDPLVSPIPDLTSHQRGSVYPRGNADWMFDDGRRYGHLDGAWLDKRGAHGTYDEFGHHGRRDERAYLNLGAEPCRAPVQESSVPYQRGTFSLGPSEDFPPVLPLYPDPSDASGGHGVEKNSDFPRHFKGKGDENNNKKTKKSRSKETDPGHRGRPASVNITQHLDRGHVATSGASTDDQAETTERETARQRRHRREARDALEGKHESTIRDSQRHGSHHRHRCQSQSDCIVQ
ncbi:hypothetical protein BJ170DRAFT_590890 [Xylariales sp. AK1849]|nr:hypothetical protein BJ170DRAFT_590890 [Xylariales sp. AK1849]